MNEKLGYTVQQTTRGNVEAAASEDFDEESLYLDCSRCSRVDCRPNLCAKSIGKCMRLDCESMQQYCDESRSAGKTGTDCSVAGKLCFQSKGRTWVGTTADGKTWTCDF